MSSDDNKNNSRRDAIKGIAVGLGALPILTNNAKAQDHNHSGHGAAQAKPAANKAPYKAKFFNPDQIALIATISDLIIPTDEHSPGAIAAEVPQFIDFMISESPDKAKKDWTDGLAAVDKMSSDKNGALFVKATKEQQIALLTEISKNEMAPKTVEEKFFKTIKGSTIDGYYTSKIGIHQELKYKGNTYLKEFKGCTHTDH